MMMITVIGRIHLLKVTEVVVIPSTADKTLMAGVNAPSPRIDGH